MTIERLPPHHPLLALVRRGEHDHLASIHPPPSHAWRSAREELEWVASAPQDPFDFKSCPSSTLLSSQLGALLIAHTGAPTATGKGKYRKNEWFLFGFRGEALLAITEKGDRGSQWFWLPRNTAQGHGRQYEADAPELAAFWPDFVVEILETVGRPILHVDRVFPPDALPCQRARAEQEKSALDEAMPGSSAAAARAFRL